MRPVTVFVCMASVSVLLLTGCGSSDPAGPGSESGGSGADWENYVSLIVGVWYEYDVTGHDVFRQCTWEGTGYTECLRETTHQGGFVVLDVLEVDDETWDCDGYVWTEVDSEHVYIKVTDDQLLLYEDLYTTDAAIMLEAPLRVGHQWEPFPGAPFTIVAEIIDIDATVEVPAGVFTDCVVSEITMPSDPGYSVRTYYAPNVGPVKSIANRPFDYEEEALRDYGIPGS